MAPHPGGMRDPVVRPSIDPTAPEAGEGRSDAALVEAMARADSTALGALYDRHHRAMLGLARLIVGDMAAAQDIVQDVFLEAWENAASYDPRRGHVRTWLMLLARSRSIDFQRSPARSRVARVGEDFWASLTAASPGEHAPDYDAIRRALGALPEDQRVAVVLGYFEDLTTAEIARRVGAPQGTVKSRISRGMAALRTMLAEGVALTGGAPQEAP